jgi:hypothetical protein
VRVALHRVTESKLAFRVSLEGDVSKFRLPTPYYIYRIVFSKNEIPQLPHSQWLSSFPHSNREIWVKQRQVRDQLLAIEPEARWEKHEARMCSLCRRWVVGFGAQIMRQRELQARLSGEALQTCGEECQ